MSENSGFYPSSLFIRNILIQKEKLLIQQSPIKSIPDVALLKKNATKPIQKCLKPLQVQGVL